MQYNYIYTSFLEFVSGWRAKKERQSPMQYSYLPRTKRCDHNRTTWSAATLSFVAARAACILGRSGNTRILAEAANHPDQPSQAILSWECALSFNESWGNRVFGVLRHKLSGGHRPFK